MAKWKKSLILMVSTMALLVTFTSVNLATTQASTLHSSSWVQARPGNILESRGVGNVVGVNGASFRVRHYRRNTNGGTVFLGQSPITNVNGSLAQTPWHQVVDVLSVAVLANVSTW